VVGQLKKLNFSSIKILMMKKIFFVLAVIFFASATRAQNEIVVDPNASVRTVNGNFNAIKISGGMDLYLSQSDNEAIAVSASEERFKEGIKTNIENNVLNIYYDGEKKWNSQKKKLRVYVSFKNLEKLNASGACDIVVSGSIAVSALSMQLSGACDFKGMVKVNTLKLNLSGASDVKISGTANTVDIESNGASDVKGYDLVTDFCNAKASGASDINITVNKELNANANGASDIHFKGSALIRDMHSSGASNISRKS
jgi:Putative auto-transporter adhesin, head GIN domain